LAHVEEMRESFELSFVGEELAVGVRTVAVQVPQKLEAEDAGRRPVAHRVLDHHRPTTLRVPAQLTLLCSPVPLSYLNSAQVTPRT